MQRIAGAGVEHDAGQIVSGAVSLSSTVSNSIPFADGHDGDAMIADACRRR
jgi:hypothetical protein